MEIVAQAALRPAPRAPPSPGAAALRSLLAQAALRHPGSPPNSQRRGASVHRELTSLSGVKLGRLRLKLPIVLPD